MSEPCRKCDRPQLSLEEALEVMRPEPGQPLFWRKYVWPIDRCPLPTWLLYDNHTGLRTQMMQQIVEECGLYAVDWRARFLELRAAVGALPEYPDENQPTWIRSWGLQANTARSAARKAARLG